MSDAPLLYLGPGMSWDGGEVVGIYSKEKFGTFGLAYSVPLQEKKKDAETKEELLAEFDAELVGDDPVRQRLLGEMKGTAQPLAKRPRRTARRTPAEMAAYRAEKEARREKSAILSEPTWLRDEGDPEFEAFMVDRGETA